MRRLSVLLCVLVFAMPDVVRLDARHVPRLDDAAALGRSRLDRHADVLQILGDLVGLGQFRPPVGPTAAHVVDGLRSVEEVIDPATGPKRQLIRFSDARIVKELVESGRRVGELAMDASVVRYSKDEDLALLRVRKTGFVDASVVFYLDDPIPTIGTRLLHVGSLLGQLGANSMTSGIMSQIGRTIDNKEFDQTTVTAFPGSSGGGVYLESGAYTGMVLRGAGEGFNLIAPIRRIRKWAERASVKWAIDDSVPMPSSEELDKLPVEDSPSRFAPTATAAKAFPTLIRKESP